MNRLYVRVPQGVAIRRGEETLFAARASGIDAVDGSSTGTWVP